jgi:cell division protein FtsQ
MTTKPSTNRADFIRQRRSNQGTTPTRGSKPAASTRRPYRTKTMYLPIEPRPRRDPKPVRKARKGQGSARNQRYDIAFSLGRTDVRAPAISLPKFNFASPRWISGLATIALAAILYLMWTSSMFTVLEAEVTGNQRIEASEISSMLGILGEPVFKAVPAQIEINLRTAYPDLADITVTAKLPNRIVVEVVERTPVIAWFQNDAMTWIDANGMAFQPRGELTGLVQVLANGAPREVQTDPTLPPFEQRFINPDLVEAITSLAPFVPAGMPMIYDPVFGIGWQDPLGWDVHFGQNIKDMQMKLTVYQVLVERLINQGIQPMLISMEFLDAPFYK